MFTFIESSTFERIRPLYLDEEEYWMLALYAKAKQDDENLQGLHKRD